MKYASGKEAVARIADLPNFGPKSQEILEQAGIETVEQLRELGAVRAYVQVKRCGINASLNLLWAMEGALTGQHWQEVAKHDRLRLLMGLEDANMRASATRCLPTPLQGRSRPGFPPDNKGR